MMNRNASRTCDVGDDTSRSSTEVLIFDNREMLDLERGRLSMSTIEMAFSLVEKDVQRRIADYYFARTCRAQWQEKNSVDFLHTPIAAFLVLHDLRSIHVDMEWVKDAEKCRRAGVSPMPWETFQKLRSEKTQHMPIFTLAFVLLLILIFIVDIGLNNWNIKGSRIMVQIGEFRTRNDVLSASAVRGHDP